MSNRRDPRKCLEIQTRTRSEHAQAPDSISQPAPALEQIVAPRKPRTNTNPKKKTRSPASGLAVDPRRYLNRGAILKDTGGKYATRQTKARMRSSLALIIRQKTSCRPLATPVLITPAGRIIHYRVILFFQYLRGKCPY